MCTRLQKEATKRLKSRFDELDAAVLSHYVQIPRTAAMNHRPDFVDFAFMEECRALVEAPESTVVTKEDFAALIPELGEQWIVAQRLQLENALAQHLEEIPENVDPLELAVAVFPCCGDGCSEMLSPLRYPAVLDHACARKLDKSTAEKRYLSNPYEFAATVYKSNPRDHYISSYKYHNYDNRWDGSQAPFDPNVFCDQDTLARAVETMRNILKTMSLAPARATITELRASDVRLRCVTCEGDQLYRGQEFIYTWEAAVGYNHSAIAPTAQLIL